MPKQATRTARVEARIAPEALAVVKRAAERQGRSISDFMVAAAQAVAMRTIGQAEMIRLSAEDQHRFAAALMNPPEPNEALQQAVKPHRGGAVTWFVSEPLDTHDRIGFTSGNMRIDSYFPPSSRRM